MVSASGSKDGLMSPLGSVWEYDAFMVIIATVRSHRVTQKAVRSYRDVASQAISMTVTVNGDIPIV